MIPKDYITEWRSIAPWQQDFMVEQDLVISRAICDLYNQPIIQESLVFRGGTALNKLFMETPSRYSEDLDFVYFPSYPIGEVMDSVRETLGKWLGDSSWKQKKEQTKLVFKFISEDNVPLKLKIEINTHESFSVKNLQYTKFQAKSSWHTASAKVTSYTIEELMATKLRALYQRKKGRDLFDIWYVITKLGINIPEMVEIFEKYNKYNDKKIPRSLLEQNIYNKLQDQNFSNDVPPLIKNISWNQSEAFKILQEKVFPLIQGKPWGFDQ